MTSDERIEIAERLRKTHGIMAFVDALGIDPDSDWCWADVSRRVADLIDPTCEAEPMDDYVPSHAFSRWRCKSCGAVSFAPRPFGMPRFCPNCSARVLPLKLYDKVVSD